MWLCESFREGFATSTPLDFAAGAVYNYPPRMEGRGLLEDQMFTQLVACSIPPILARQAAQLHPEVT